MGMILRSSEEVEEHARALMSQKDVIEAELDSQFAILRANSATMQTRLVDAEGFPRADLDIYAIRHARVRIIELNNESRINILLHIILVIKTCESFIIVV